MITKLFEVRAPATLIPAIAIRLEPTNSQDSWLLAHEGFGMSSLEQKQFILMGRIDSSPATLTYDPKKHPEYELQIAHDYIIKNFDDLASGAVIDTDYIKGLTPTPVKSDRYYYQNKT